MRNRVARNWVAGLVGLALAVLLALPAAAADPAAPPRPAAPARLDKPQLAQVLAPRLRQVTAGQPFQAYSPRWGALVVEPTISRPLQAEAEELLNGLKSARAAMALVEVPSGRVLALAGVRHGRLDPGVALDGSAPAASLYKIVTAAAAVEETQLNPMSRLTFTGRPHSLTPNQVRIGKARQGAQATLRESFAISNNPVFAKLGVYHIGVDLLTWYGKALGFESRLPFELPLGTSRLYDCDSDFEVAGLASGYNSQTTISPVHAALLAGVFVNRGRLMEPYVVARVSDPAGNQLYQGRPSSLGRIVSDATCQAMQEMFEATITEGTARRAFHHLGQDRVLRDISLGGKTGTISGPDKSELFEWFAGYGRDDSTGRTIAVSAVVVHHSIRHANPKQLSRQLLRAAFSGSTHVVSQRQPHGPRL
ncbi:MAG: penicillin-binding transpeptidase domain-containing protein [Thermodesulfobacteriota bacterium]